MLVCQDAGLWLTIHAALNLHVDIAIEGFLPQIVVFKDVLWKQLEGHLHVLVSIKRCFRIHIFDISSTKFGSWGTDDAVPHYFCRDHVGCTCGEFVQIIYEVATNSDPNSIWVLFWGALADDNLCIHDSLIFWDAFDFSMGKVKKCVGTNCDTFFSLGQAMQLL